MQERQESIEPIKLTAIGDLLIVSDHRCAFGIGTHQGCGGMVSLREGPTDLSRLVCECGCFAILVSKQAKSCEELRHDIEMRYLGLSPAGLGPEHVPYAITAAARRSVES